ncbi:MAG TPA: protein kinase [Acidobacteriaceae bacterium]|nr:protein kinase [Acidobacteriaceae bacterium]
MDRTRWLRIQELFHGAADLPDHECQSYLNSECGSDEQLVTEVKALLAEDSHPGSLLDQDVALVAGRILADGDTHSLPTAKFDPYHIVGILGEGGMGVVYLAERQDLGSRVAVKVLRDAWLSPARRERFLSEQRMLAQLNHPAIARLYDADTLDDGTPWFVMEYVEGVPLSQYCREHQCSILERLRLFRAVCEAVQYAHQNAVIHRDLKPSNVLVKADGSVRLLDFGISKQLESLDRPIDQTRTGLRLMTPAYASPEQIRGERVGVQTDVYSLGVILYELLAGRLPFDLSDRTPGEAERILVQEEPKKPSTGAAKLVKQTPSVAPTVSVSRSEWADLDVLCLMAMHKDTKRRYQSVEALIRDVDHYLNREPLEARPDTVDYRLRKFVSRHRRSVTAGAAIFLTVTGLVVYFTLRLAAERDTANREKTIAAEVNKFLSDDLLGRANPFRSGKATESLTQAIREASPRIDLKFAAEPGIAAQLHLTIAQALDNRSDFQEARQEYARARDLFLRADGPLSEDAIEVQLQCAAMEARSFTSGGVAAAKSLIAQQEMLLSKIERRPKHLTVWLYTAKGMLALVESDDKSANHYFKLASDDAESLPEFDETARYDLRQRLAFTYLRLGDGATAERLARQLIAGYSAVHGPDSPYVLRMRLNLAQAYLVERKFSQALEETNSIYPAFLRQFGPDHELTMQLLTTRAQSEGSLGRFDNAVRDDVTVYKSAVKRQGPLSFYAIATLSDASESECRANHLLVGEQSARKAYHDSVSAFGRKSALSEATLLPLANCLISLGKLPEASRDLDQIDAKAVVPLTGDPHWGAGIALARAGIAVRERKYALARKEIDYVQPIFSRPDVDVYQRHKMESLSTEISRHLQSR